jgi:uncharacterized protein YcfJ
MKHVTVVGIALLAIVLSGCESVGTAAQSKRNQGAVLGGLLGAGTGAIIGNQSDHAGAGTAIGAGLGALGGALVGNAMEEKDRKVQQQTFPPATNVPQQQQQAPVTTGRVKFSPVTGKEYPEHMKYDPETGVELRYKE